MLRSLYARISEAWASRRTDVALEKLSSKPDPLALECVIPATPVTNHDSTNQTSKLAVGLIVDVQREV